jgi:hypothetical protein
MASTSAVADAGDAWLAGVLHPIVVGVGPQEIADLDRRVCHGGGDVERLRHLGSGGDRVSGHGGDVLVVGEAVENVVDAAVAAEGLEGV